MRRKNYLLALALPAMMLGACAQEDFVATSNSNGDLNLVENPIENFNLVVDYDEDGVDTRVTTGSAWQVGDQMGLVWFNPNYWTQSGSTGEWSMNEMNAPYFYANNMFTISAGANGEGLWTSDAVIMEGKHFAYFPFQTVWGDDYLQVKGGQEILKVYNTADQQDEPGANRLYWMMNHQTLLSPAYEFTADNGGAGISDERRIDLYLFSNRLNIQPVFENAPSNLVVYKYELKMRNNYPSFVTEGEILANELPMSNDFGGCNWATMGNENISLTDIYRPTKWATSLTVSYPENNYMPAANAEKFTFLLLPATIDDYQSSGNQPSYSVPVQLVAHTNYGSITVTEVTGRFDANMTTESTITLSELYFNGTSNNPTSANTYVGFMDNAGVTRGGTTGNNGDITATFDFADIELDGMTVCDEVDFMNALEQIRNIKSILGDEYTAATIMLCPETTFTDFDLSGTKEAFEEETGVTVTVKGYDANGDGNYSDEGDGTVITWVGECSIAERIAGTTNIVEGTLYANATNGKGLPGTTVREGGKLVNQGIAERVTVEEGGIMDNYGTASSVYNYGYVKNTAAETADADDQPTIENLYNYATVDNYANIEYVMANDNEAGTAVINLLDNENLAENGTYELGAIFKIGNVSERATNITYTVDEDNEVRAATHLAAALTNYATNISVTDGTDIRATASDVLNGGTFDARITFLGTTTYTISSASKFDNTLKVAEIVLAENAALTVENEQYLSGTLTQDVYALAADKFAMNNNSLLTVGGGTLIAVEEVYVAPNNSATIKTELSKEHSGFYFVYESVVDGGLYKTGNVNQMPDEIKAHFGWS